MWQARYQDLIENMFHNLINVMDDFSLIELSIVFIHNEQVRMVNNPHYMHVHEFRFVTHVKHVFG